MSDVKNKLQWLKSKFDQCDNHLHDELLDGLIEHANRLNCTIPDDLRPWDAYRYLTRALANEIFSFSKGSPFLVQRFNIVAIRRVIFIHGTTDLFYTVGMWRKLRVSDGIYSADSSLEVYNEIMKISHEKKIPVRIMEASPINDVGTIYGSTYKAKMAELYDADHFPIRYL